MRLNLDELACRVRHVRPLSSLPIKKHTDLGNVAHHPVVNHISHQVLAALRVLHLVGRPLIANLNFSISVFIDCGCQVADFAVFLDFYPLVLLLLYFCLLFALLPLLYQGQVVFF